MNEDLEYEIFIKHLIGVTNLFSWIEQWRMLGYYEQDKKINYLFNFNSIMSQRFMFGLPLNKVKHGDNPFLALQTLEYNWATCIQWSKICVDFEKSRLYLVSKKIKTTKGNYIPVFAISILFSAPEMLFPLKDKKHISLKNLWYEDEIEAGYEKKNYSWDKDEVINSKLDLTNYENPILSVKSKDIILPLFVVNEIDEIIREDDLKTELTGDYSILDRLRSNLSLDPISDKIIAPTFVKGSGSVSFSDEEKLFLSKLKKPLDFKKPKIRIRVD